MALNDSNPSVQIALLLLIFGLFGYIGWAARRRAHGQSEPNTGWQRRSVAQMRTHPWRWGLKWSAVVFVVLVPLGLLAGNIATALALAACGTALFAVMLFFARRADEARPVDGH